MEEVNKSLDRGLQQAQGHRHDQVAGDGKNHQDSYRDLRDVAGSGFHDGGQVGPEVSVYGVLLHFQIDKKIAREAADSAVRAKAEATTYRIDLEMELSPRNQRASLNRRSGGQAGLPRRELMQHQAHTHHPDFETKKHWALDSARMSLRLECFGGAQRRRHSAVARACPTECLAIIDPVGGVDYSKCVKPARR